MKDRLLRLPVAVKSRIDDEYIDNQKAIEKISILPDEFRGIIGSFSLFRVIQNLADNEKPRIYGKISPALSIVRNNFYLPSNTGHFDGSDNYDIMKGSHAKVSSYNQLMAHAASYPFTAIADSLPSWSSWKPAEILLSPLVLANRVYAWGSSYLEFGLVTLGAVLNYPLHGLRKLIEEESYQPTWKKIAKGIFFGITLVPGLCASLMVTLAADTLSYSRSLLDGVTNTCVSVVSKFTKCCGDKNKYASIGSSVFATIKSAIQLAPTIALGAFIVITGGLGALLAAPLKAAGTYLAKKIVLGGLFSGAVAAAGKLVSGIFQLGTNWYRRNQKFKANNIAWNKALDKAALEVEKEPNAPTESTTLRLQKKFPREKSEPIATPAPTYSPTPSPKLGPVLPMLVPLLNPVHAHSIPSHLTDVGIQNTGRPIAKSF